MRDWRLRSVLVCVVCFGGAVLASEDVPVIVRSTEVRYSAALASNGEVVRGEVQRRRVEHRDELGRLLRWEELDATGARTLSWVGMYTGHGLAPTRAGYWDGEDLLPFPELFVSTPDGRVQDVLYWDHGEKPRRQIRQYVDASGRELYQEYFGPRSQRKYSEEIYRYDGFGNELGRTWRRLDGKAQRETRFEISERDAFGHWLVRRVYIDDVLTGEEERTVVYGTARRAHPPAGEGPVASSSEILPIPFAPGVVSAANTGENALSFAPDGARVFFSRYEGSWEEQRGYESVFRDGAWRDAEALPFAEVLYNLAVSEDGRRVVYCQRDDALAGARVFVIDREEQDGVSSWGTPVDLTAGHGLVGSYFRLLADGTLYFHVRGDLYRCRLGDDGVSDVGALGSPINTSGGVEFGAWVDRDGERLIFTRDVEGAPASSGVFVSFGGAGSWSEPARLPIPYGWGVVVSPDGEDLVYVIDDDVYRVPVALLGDALSGPVAED